jgi:hypothetical protein
MKTLLTATAAAAALALSGPAMADDHMVELTTAQQTMYDGWPEERRMTYDGWPMEAQSYYWTLTPEQTEAWWMLTDEQRVRVVGMTDAQQTAAWQSIISQINGTATAPAATQAQTNASSTATTSGDVRFVSNEMVQNAPAPHNGEYPVCTANMQDNCMNPWEAGQRGRGVTKPLEYWPGEPASEM